MPWYDYQCRNCDETFSLERPVAERDDAARCPRCGSTDSERLLSTFISPGSSNDRAEFCGFG